MQKFHHLEAKNLRFSVFSSKNIKSLSVAKVVTPMLFDALGHALPGGLYDPKMGPFSINSDPCATCYKTLECNGHMGHIELSMLVYNPIFIKIVHDILRITCFSCFRLQISEHVLEILILQLRLLDAGYIIEAQDIEIFKSEVVQANAKRDDDDGDEGAHSKLDEYKRLLETGLQSYDVVENTKNSEALRTSIVSSSIKNNPNKRCIHCKEALKKVKFSFKKLMVTASKSELDSSLNDSIDARGRSKNLNKALLADECREYLRKVYDMHDDILKLLFPVLMHAPEDLEYGIDIFFMDIIPVPPPLVRPANKFKNEIREHPQTTILKNIVEANVLLKAICSKINETVAETQASEILALYESATGDTPYEKMYNAWQSLQTCVDQTWDSTLGQNTHGVQGLKQVLEKKTGIIRLHMMGKRVNYAARTVITPDPFINVDEIGLPEVFARKLSYPVPVTPWNVTELRKMVINGPNVHPGANFVEDEFGRVKVVSGVDPAKRESLAKMLLTPTERGIKIVHRHLLNNDVMLLNRQPTLHKNSIMAHKVRILKGEKTFRLHYSNCKSYNADFDGDEMNAHVPQNELGRSEAYNLINVPNQYLVAKDGTPLGGLIQDHVISGVKMSMRGRFFNKEDYQQLVFVALAHTSKEIKFLPPTILKPIRLWSGKQILSTILMNIIPDGSHKINLKSTAKTNVKSWQTQEERPWLAGGTPLTDINMTESEVVIRGGELLVGVLDKTHYGATPYGLIHCMYELYGGQSSTQLLSSFSKVFTFFLQREGFTLGVRDILVLPGADKNRKKVIKKTRKIGPEAVAAALELPKDTPFEILAEKMSEAIHRDPKFRTLLDRAYKSTLDSYTNRINKICLPAGLLCKFPENNLQLMVGSGAKGSTVNTMQISCLLGQIELEGKRPPMMISGRTLPCFPEFEMCPKAGGFIDGRFMTGIQPQDFFFHCMAGREGLIDTAVKTSRSGYLQRCLIKHLEGLNVHYDMTVRDSDNSVVQFMYGEDGMDISKSQFLNTKQFPFLYDNVRNIIPNEEFLDELKDSENYDNVIKHKKKLRSWRKKHAPVESKRRETSFQRFSREIVSDIELKNPNKTSKKTGRRKIDEQIVKLWSEADDEQKAKYSKKCMPCPDPVVSKYQPDCNFASLPEHVENLMVNYMKNLNIDSKSFENVIAVKTMKSLAAPGEPVGLLAAQSIGEPSTQMTLNTFHFAGRGEMNVTLGIPRLREILMFATENIKTPSLDIPFIKHKNMDEHADTLRKKMARVTVADVLESINVQSNLVLRPSRAKNYCVRFNFLPREAYEQDFAVTPKRILRHMRESFFRLMFKAIAKAAQEKLSSVDIGTEEKKKKVAEDYQDRDIDEREPENDTTQAGGIDSSDDEAIGEDDDATAVKLKSKAMDECDYDEAAVEEGEKGDASDNDSDVEMYEQGENVIEEQDEEEKIAGLESNEYNTQYRVDKYMHLWCELTFQLGMSYKNVDISIVLKEVASKSVISEVPLIKRAITYNKNGDTFLKTDGINITEMFKHMDVLDLNRLYTNQIHAMAQKYGIEAAARVIVKEVQQVFQVYGITVDPRHLLLIADYMTFDGTFKPLSRSGIESSASPLQQMSFESTLKFLKSAIVKSQLDSLSSPSSRLMVGQPCKSGTGSFTCMTNNSFLFKNLLK